MDMEMNMRSTQIIIKDTVVVMFQPIGGAEFAYRTMFDSHSPTFDLTETDTQSTLKRKYIYMVFQFIVSLCEDNCMIR